MTDSQSWAAIIAAFASVVVVCMTFLFERGITRAERARNRLAAGGDALERFHWDLRDALQFFPVDGLDRAPEAKRVAAITTKLDASRAEASRQGTQLAIEFGKDSFVVGTYDRRQEAYRRIMVETLGDRCAGIEPINKTGALGLAKSLAAFEGCVDFIEAASHAAKAREWNLRVPMIGPKEKKERRGCDQQKAYESLNAQLRHESSRT